MSTTEVNNFLMAGGVPGAKFSTIGTVIKGSIVDATVSQQTDFTSGKPKHWDNGDPMMQAVITLQTDDRDASIDGDDGLRKLYVKGQMQFAVQQALRQVGAKGLDVGGVLAVKYTGDKPAEKPGMNPAKQYIAQYQPPSQTAVANDLINAGSDTPAGGVAADDLL